MLFRVALIFAALMGAGYGVLWLITCTDYFGDPGRVRRIAKRFALFLLSFVLALCAFMAIVVGDHTF